MRNQGLERRRLTGKTPGLAAPAYHRGQRATEVPGGYHRQLMAKEERLSRVFVELADTLVSGFDVVEFLHLLTERCVELLDVGAAGVILVDEQGVLRVMASSDERAHTLELFEVQNQEGPCLDCIHSGKPVVNQPLHREGNRWPAFSREARAVEFRFAHALPLRLRDQILGALNLFSDEESRLAETGLVVGQALADVATIGLLQARATEDARVLAEQLQGALSSRVVIERAKGHARRACQYRSRRSLPAPPRLCAQPQ